MSDMVKYEGMTLETVRKYALLAKQGGIVPPQMSEAAVAAIIQSGYEIGLAPFQSLRSMSFIGGKLTMSVQLQLAMARAKGVKILKDAEGEHEYTVTLSRGDENVTCSYTLDDAKKAGLLRPGGNYEKYERQMLRWRAIGDALRLIAPDAVLGLLSPEEASSLESTSGEAGGSHSPSPVSSAPSAIPAASPDSGKGGGAEPSTAHAAGSGTGASPSSPITLQDAREVFDLPVDAPVERWERIGFKPDHGTDPDKMKKEGRGKWVKNDQKQWEWWELRMPRPKGQAEATTVETQPTERGLF